MYSISKQIQIKDLYLCDQKNNLNSKCKHGRQRTRRDFYSLKETVCSVNSGLWLFKYRLGKRFN